MIKFFVEVGCGHREDPLDVGGDIDHILDPDVFVIQSDVIRCNNMI